MSNRRFIELEAIEENHLTCAVEIMKREGLIEDESKVVEFFKKYNWRVVEDYDVAVGEVGQMVKVYEDSVFVYVCCGCGEFCTYRYDSKNKISCGHKVCYHCFIGGCEYNNKCYGYDNEEDEEEESEEDEN